MRNFKLLACYCDCTGWFVSDLVGTQIVGFLMHGLILYICSSSICACSVLIYILISAPYNLPRNFIFLKDKLVIDMIVTGKQSGSDRSLDIVKTNSASFNSRRQTPVRNQSVKKCQIIVHSLINPIRLL